MLLKKYKNLSSGVKASIWFIFCSIIQKAISFITVPIFTRLLSTAEYGEYSLFLAWQEIITIFATLNLNYQVFNNGMVKYKNDKDGYTTSMIGLGFVSSVFTFMIILAIYPFWYKHTNINYLSLTLMSINMFFLLIYGLWTVRNRYDYKYKLLTLLTIIMALLNPLLGILLVKLSTQKVLFRIVSIVLTSVLIGIISLIFLMRKSRSIVNIKYWKYALSLGIPLIPHYISMVVLHSSDRIMIGNIVGEEYTAFYSVSYNVAVIMQIVLNAINASFVPFIYKNMESKKYDNIRKNSLPIIIIVALLCLFPMFLAPEAIYILGGNQYMDAVTIVPILSSSVFMIFFYSIFVSIEMYFEKSKYITIGSSCAAILNIVLNIVFIRIFGYKAAAYTTLVSYISLAFFHYIMYKRICKKNCIRESIFDTKIMIFIALLLLLLSIIISCIYNNIVIRYSFLVVILIITLINKNKIISILNKIKENNKKKVG